MLQERVSRRRWLQLSNALFLLLPGCLSNGSDGVTESNSSPEPTHSGSLSELNSEGSARPAPSCPDGYESFTSGWVVEGSGPLGGFDLVIRQDTYEQGDELVAELRNVTDDRQVSGNKGKIDLQYQGPNGWHTVFGIPQDTNPIWTSEGIAHPPGEGFTWRLPLSQEGLSEGAIESFPSYQACQQIVPGKYRFVYWGITTEQEREEDFETDYALGEKFTVV